MATEAPESESADAAPCLPEKIAPADLEALNQGLEELFGELRLRVVSRRAKRMGGSAL
jgi:hypothetical protein